MKTNIPDHKAPQALPILLRIVSFLSECVNAGANAIHLGALMPSDNPDSEEDLEDAIRAADAMLLELVDEGDVIPMAGKVPTIVSDAFAQMRKNRQEQRAAVTEAKAALARLCRVMCDRSGQCYKVRDLLYSLYNGQETSLLEVVALDWQLQKDVSAVVMAFGFEDLKYVDNKPVDGVSFYYAEMKAAIEAVGQWEWFIAAHKEESEVEA